MTDGKDAEAPQLDAVPARQRSNDLIEYGTDNLFGIALIEMRVLLGKLYHKFRFDHD
jgi:hypothetical protein